MSSCQSGKYSGYPPPPPPKLLAKPWDHPWLEQMFDRSHVRRHFPPAFIFRSTSVGGSMTTINNKTDKDSFWKISLLMTTTWPSSTPPDVNTVFQFTMLLLLLLFLAAPTHRPSPGCSGSTNQAPYHKPSYNLVKPFNLRWRIGDRECLFRRKW